MFRTWALGVLVCSSCGGAGQGHDGDGTIVADAEAEADAELDTAPPCLTGRLERPATACPSAIAAARGAAMGAPVRLTESLALGLAVDRTHVFWSEQLAGSEHGTIRRMPKAGGAVETLASERENPIEIVVDGDHVYWNEQTIRSGIVRARKDGSELSALVGNAFAIAVREDTLFFTSLQDQTVSSFDLISRRRTDLATFQEAAQSVFVGAGAIWWTAFTPGGVSRIGDGSTTIERFADTPFAGRRVVADCHAAYWLVNERVPRLQGRLLSGGPVVDLACGGLDFAIDAEYLYLSGAEVTRVPLNGGASERIGPGFTGPPYRIPIVVDDSAVYWRADGGIYRASKAAP